LPPATNFIIKGNIFEGKWCKIMSDLKAFLKQNKKEKENIKYVASQDFKDENGKPIEWEIRPLKSKEMDNIRAECTSINHKGKGTNINQAKFNRMMCAKATVFPNLNDVELQNSYGVMSAEDLIQELLDNDGDYSQYTEKVLEVAGYNKSEEDLVEEVKN